MVGPVLRGGHAERGGTLAGTERWHRHARDRRRVGAQASLARRSTRRRRVREPSQGSREESRVGMSTASPPARVRRSPPRLQRYGRYVLVDRLGAGGMAEVFRSVVIGPEQFERVVVLKRILPHLTENPSFVKMFIDEATLCGRLSHPNIIQVYEFGREDGSYFIAMEYVEGLILATVLGDLAERQENVPVTLTADVLRQTCLGLGYAHG